MGKKVSKLPRRINKPMPLHMTATVLSQRLIEQFTKMELVDLNHFLPNTLQAHWEAVMADNNNNIFSCSANSKYGPVKGQGLKAKVRPNKDLMLEEQLKASFILMDWMKKYICPGDTVREWEKLFYGVNCHWMWILPSSEDTLAWSLANHWATWHHHALCSR